ncbi:hypothetical protein F2Q69_00022534 [Brassica cretica]|uniref:Uncharacterized protein n=1 Tax=Brassica cretica TaxID=69181 RepID=A0A8S9QP80_BRACR|nr:hypothetical protein F2Q69_00022534 [Brassica cretica]
MSKCSLHVSSPLMARTFAMREGVEGSPWCPCKGTDLPSIHPLDLTNKLHRKQPVTTTDQIVQPSVCLSFLSGSFSEFSVFSSYDHTGAFPRTAIFFVPGWFISLASRRVDVCRGAWRAYPSCGGVESSVFRGSDVFCREGVLAASLDKCLSPLDLFVEFIIPRWLLLEGLKYYNEFEAWVHSDEDVAVRREVHVSFGCFVLFAACSFG